MDYTEELKAVIGRGAHLAEKMGHRYLTPEHIVYGMLECRTFADFYQYEGGSIEKLRDDIFEYLELEIEKMPDGTKDMEVSNDFEKVLALAQEQAYSSGRKVVDVSHVFSAILTLKDSYAQYFLSRQGVDLIELLGEMSRSSIAADQRFTKREVERKSDDGRESFGEFEQVSRDGFPEFDQTSKKGIQEFSTCMNEICMDENPLIGREKELERTVQILCRMEKNNVLHVGEPGVGKTAITFELARRICKNEVPDPLKGSVIYALDLSSLLAGTQYRGDFEKRFKNMMDGILKEDKPIVYIDEIHNIVGAGAVNGGSLDVSNMLKPYLAAGYIRFIGATTYEEYKKYLVAHKSLIRRFQKVDIAEPTIEQTIEILNGLKSRYEAFHGVCYAKGVMEHAATSSGKYINERFLPDKAIDLIDEAGAFRRIHPLKQKIQTVGKQLIDDVLSEICNIPKKMVEKNEVEKLAELESDLNTQVFGQKEAIEQIANAVKFSKAGLNEDGKPIASFLFVGATGVGKTESARALAKELGISLIRFDMSEYSEKHAVAKLIGSPAGYVGYEEGGLLTEEIRKHPHAVLLLDEIEKAHPDIYNILLQVMDYATLTDNQGRKADFRNIILIMTSNAGASLVGKNLIGFDGDTTGKSAIEDAVKRTFQPEFRNRLSRIVLFHNMDDAMAEKITEKKLSELKEKMKRKNVQLSITQKAVEHIRNAGITKEYGAREIDRVIEAEVKPLLVSSLLFGKLKKGGACVIEEREGELKLELEP